VQLLKPAVKQTSAGVLSAEYNEKTPPDRSSGALSVRLP